MDQCHGWYYELNHGYSLLGRQYSTTTNIVESVFTCFKTAHHANDQVCAGVTLMKESSLC